MEVATGKTVISQLTGCLGVEVWRCGFTLLVCHTTVFITMSQPNDGSDSC